MIISFYIIALTRTDQLILIGDQGGCHLLLIVPVNCCEWNHFTRGIFWLSNKWSCQSLDNDFGGLVKIKGNKWRLTLGFKSATIQWAWLYFVTKNVALQLVTLLVFLSHVLSKTKWGSFLWNLNTIHAKNCLHRGMWNCSTIWQNPACVDALSNPFTQ